MTFLQLGLCIGDIFTSPSSTFFFVGQVMRKAITLYLDRVSLSLSVLQDMEDEEKALAANRPTKTESNDDNDAAPSVDPQGEGYELTCHCAGMRTEFSLVDAVAIVH